VSGPRLAKYYGNYYGTPARSTTMLEGIRQAVGPAVQVTYSQGCPMSIGPARGVVELPAGDKKALGSREPRAFLAV
jgi:hypothetical protein